MTTIKFFSISYFNSKCYLNLTGFTFSTDLRQNDQWPLIMEPSRNIYDLLTSDKSNTCGVLCGFFIAKARNLMSPQCWRWGPSCSEKWRRSSSPPPLKNEALRGTTFLQDVGDQLSSGTPSHSRRLESSAILWWEAHLSHMWLRCLISYSADLTKFHENAEVSGNDKKTK